MNAMPTGHTTEPTPRPIVSADVAHRIQMAIDGNPDVPAPNYGRLGWFQAQFAQNGVGITPETVRRWLSGEARPRHKMLIVLAKVLRVDVSWLAAGSDPERAEKDQRARNAAAAGVVNLVAGVVQICGGAPAFPDEGDERAKREGIDLYAIIKGAQYAMHVTAADEVADGWRFSVPVNAIPALVIGVIRTGPLAFTFVELDREGLETVGKRKGGTFDVVLDKNLFTGDRPWRKIETFAARL